MKRNYKFNDWPFNAMRFLTPTLIEAHFNLGNPKEKDTITKGDKKYIIKNVEWTDNIYLFNVKEIKVK